MGRVESLMIITKRLIILVFISIILLGAIFGIAIFFKKLMVSWICLICGIMGGFVSIQQRLKNISDEELKLLSNSWFEILLIPIYGGIFAWLLYLIFLSEIISGTFFPSFDTPLIDKSAGNLQWVKDMLLNTYPSSLPDFAKLFLWSFIAGFSERFVPQIIAGIAEKSGIDGDDDNDI